MKQPATPVDESQRLASLHESGLLEPGNTQRFDRLTRLARRLFNVPVSLIALVDAEALVFKSCDGLAYSAPARKNSFCTHTIHHETPLIVADATLDERFCANPMVTGEPHIRFYAGHPLRLPDGAIVGSFCLVDYQPRTFSEADLINLQDLAQIVEDEFAGVSAATTDELTGLFNRRAFRNLASFAISAARRRAEPLTLGWLDLDRFKQINDSFGHRAGDEALCAMAALLKRCFRESDLLVRYGGDEFAIVFGDTDEKGAWIAMQHLVDEATLYNQASGQPWQLAFSWGVTEFNHDSFSDLQSWLSVADRRMYAMKAQHHGET
jgi:diguanylate cyclase (GGDEF)-like protein